MIRDYEQGDGVALTAVHNTLYPNHQFTQSGWQRHIERIMASDGRVWVITTADKPIGYAAVLRVPGLPGLVEMEGFIAPRQQRQGWGSRLLSHMCHDLSGSSVNQLSYATPTLDSPAARFLLKNNFFIEHEEWTMEWSMVNGQWSLVNGHWSLTIDHFPRSTAVPLFCQLYTASFMGTPWDQPFSEAEVADLLTNSDDLHFLLEDGRPIGFVWVHRSKDEPVSLEPIGIIPEKQGQGYGRWLLQTVLQRLMNDGVTAVTLGVWANNNPAIHLYQSLGFHNTTTLTYLACNL